MSADQVGGCESRIFVSEGCGVGGFRRVSEIVEGGEVGAGFVVWIYIVPDEDIKLALEAA